MPALIICMDKPARELSKFHSIEPHSKHLNLYATPCSEGAG